MGRSPTSARIPHCVANFVALDDDHPARVVHVKFSKMRIRATLKPDWAQDLPPAYPHRNLHAAATRNLMFCFGTAAWRPLSPTCAIWPVSEGIKQYYKRVFLVIINMGKIQNGIFFCFFTLKYLTKSLLYYKVLRYMVCKGPCSQS